MGDFGARQGSQDVFGPKRLTEERGYIQISPFCNLVKSEFGTVVMVPAVAHVSIIFVAGLLVRCSHRISGSQSEPGASDYRANYAAIYSQGGTVGRRSALAANISHHICHFFRRGKSLD